MSKNSIIIIAVVVVVIIVGGASFYFMRSNKAGESAQTSANQSVPVTVTSSTQSASSAAPAAGDTSDAAIDQELGNIDSQMNGLASDTASVDQGLNDQAVPQQQL